MYKQTNCFGECDWHWRLEMAVTHYPLADTRFESLALHQSNFNAEVAKLVETQ